MQNLTEMFASKGFSQPELVTLSGAHTIGFEGVRQWVGLQEPRNGKKGLLDRTKSCSRITLCGTRDRRASARLEEDFGRVMVKLADLGVLTGSGGEIREDCSIVNSNSVAGKNSHELGLAIETGMQRSP